LAGRTLIWPAGVDVDYWNPVNGNNQNKNLILIYEKQIKGSVGPIDPYKQWMESLGYEVRVIKYGQYNLEEFRLQLHSASLLVGFVKDESQGLAWAEAWASDVPTLLWENSEIIFRNKVIESSTAPYLSDLTGSFFKNIYDFKISFESWRSRNKVYAPRQWVLNNMSDEVCARNLCDAIKINTAAKR
jgi:hypothetical protein